MKKETLEAGKVFKDEMQVMPKMINATNRYMFLTE